MTDRQIIKLDGPIDSALIVNKGPTHKDCFWMGFFGASGVAAVVALGQMLHWALMYLVNLAKGWW
jgi:hypothetical protein